MGGTRTVGLDLPSSQVLRVSMRGPEFLGYTHTKYLDWNLVSSSTRNIEGKGKL